MRRSSSKFWKTRFIHDLALSGEDPDVKHQIDVTIEVAGSRRRVVIECKDFDISGEKVGLDIIRNFRSVIEDTKADEGYVITCNSFTADARKYAKSKGIKLCVLRIFEDVDLNGRITRIIVNVTLQQPQNPIVEIMIGEHDGARYRGELAAIGVVDHTTDTDPVFVVKGTERIQINEFMTARMNDAIRPGGPKAIRIEFPSDGRQLQIDRNPLIPFSGVIVKFDVDTETHTLDVVSRRVAEMILTGVGESDIIIFGDQIGRHSIDPITGAVR